MAAVPAVLHVFFQDDAGRESEVAYRLATDADNATGAGAGVMTNVTDLIAALNTLSMDFISHWNLEIQMVETVLVAPNDAATNGIYAFVRTELAADSSEKRYFIVPAWDTLLYEEGQSGVLDAAFETDALVAMALIKDMDGGGAYQYDFGQSRQRKVFKKGLG